MRYLCVHCDHRFEHEGDDEARCPKCMRQNGLEEVRQGSVERSRTWMWALVGLAVIAGGGYAWWAATAPEVVTGPPPLRPLEADTLTAHLNKEGVSLSDVPRLLEPTEAVEELAEASSVAGSPAERAKAFVGALRARAKKQAFVTWSVSHPRKEALYSVDELVAKLGKDDGKAKLYPVELACLAVSALRSVDVDAMVAEVWEYDGDRAPPDSAGYFGYYAVAVWPGTVGEGDPVLLDPYAGRTRAPGEGAYRALTDVEVMGALAQHRAVRLLMQEGDEGGAFDLSEAALKLDPRSPSARTAHGYVLLQSGALPEGLRELEAAAQIRPDAPRRKNLAVIHLAQGDVESAAREIALALEQYPDYAEAHAMLGAVHLSKGEHDLARSELSVAEQLDPDLITLAPLLAQLALQTGNIDEAVARSRTAIEARPHNWQTRLQAAQVYRQAGLYDEMRREARKIVELVPAKRRGQIRELIQQVLGPTAFDEIVDEEPAEEEPVADSLALPDPDLGGELKLGQGSRLLGDGADDGLSLGGSPSLGGGSLLGDGPSGAADPLIPSGEGPKLRLGASGGSLQLDLSE